MQPVVQCTDHMFPIRVHWHVMQSYTVLEDDIGVFNGIQFYNEMLLQAGANGNLQTEILRHKDTGIFSFREGWAFPKKISINGEQCVLPSPQDHSRLLNAASKSCAPATSRIILSLLLLQRC
ncbi:unnamed protein product [Fraxinus pennsylvanica]|uniref:COBRA C-terminal domain-containing protein n=1 Tax=Fraxinus pennsylvanica TaxID=56036 RepID=A0AAD2DV90_9LAMI|nr:unnamed protein product [Fraxinus pennsylvanica]